MKDALVRLSLFNLVVKDERLERLHGCRGPVQRLVANRRGGGRLVRQRLGDLEVVKRGRADGPGVAEDRFSLAVEIGKLGRIGLRSEQRKGSLASS